MPRGNRATQRAEVERRTDALLRDFSENKREIAVLEAELSRSDAARRARLDAKISRADAYYESRRKARAAEAAEKERLSRAKKASYRPPRRTLTREERQRVRGALGAAGDANEVLVQHFRIPVKRRDLQTLKTRTDRVTRSLWLTDEIINFWMELLQQESDARAARGASAGPDGEPSPSCHFFSSFFFSKLMFDMGGGYCYTNVRRWTRKLHHEKDIFGRDCIVVPINIGNSHWTWACIFPKRRRIEYYDSFGGGGQRYCKALLRFLVDDANDKRDRPDRKGSPVHDFDPEGWVLSDAEVPQQGNGYDCGVFTCVGALHLSRNMPMDSFSQGDMPFFRESIALSVLSKQVVPALPKADGGSDEE
jgi:sentrin-specific protease 1